MDDGVSAAPDGAARVVVLAEPTCSALGLAASRPTARSEVAAVALRLLDPAPLSELADGLIESLDDLIVGVVEAVEECVLAPPPDCPNLRTRAEVEAVSWVDDFIADDAPDDPDAVSQQVMFQLACLVADAVADAVTARTHAEHGTTSVRIAGREMFDLRRVADDVRRVVDDLRRRGVEAVRWSLQLATPLRWLHR